MEGGFATSYLLNVAARVDKRFGSGIKDAFYSIKIVVSVNKRSESGIDIKLYDFDIFAALLAIAANILFIDAVM